MAAARSTYRLAAQSHPLLKSAVSAGTSLGARHVVRQQARRGFASGASTVAGTGSIFTGMGLGAALAGGTGYYYFISDTPSDDAETVKRTADSSIESKAEKKAESKAEEKAESTDESKAESAGNSAKASINTHRHNPKPEDYQTVYNYIAKLLEEHDEYDDGSYGPVVLRLAWHCSGTYDAESGTGGSNGATMRFDPESDHGANSGLAAARDFLEPVKEKFPWITYSDMWTLAGVCAVQEMQGPVVPWRPGRSDRDATWCTPDGRLPDGSKGPKHLRGIFGRMGFNDQEIVALSGAHALGRCHTERSGFEGPWTFSPTVVTNDFYTLLLDEKWHIRKWDGNRQWQDGTSKSLMMLPTDMALVEDNKFKPYVEKYAKDVDLFFKDFSNVIVKLFELGVPFKTSADSRLRFKTVDAQEADS